MVTVNHNLGLEHGEEIAVAFQFQSRVNSGNVRLQSLFKNSRITRTVRVRGFKLPGSDRLVLLLLPLYRMIRLRTDLRKFKWIHIMSPEEGIKLNINQILHLDDPTFTPAEQKEIALWSKIQISREKRGIIVCTSEKIKQYCQSISPSIPVEVIPQGFTPIIGIKKKYQRFTCVYSSPYIFFRGDKYADHPSWGSTHLLEDLIPKILDIHDGIDVHLIGRLGKHARKRVGELDRVVAHGLVSPQDNAVLLSKCHLALYPRLHDHGRRVLKISEYMGAGLPIVAYLNEDTLLVSELDIGIRVQNSEEFISSVARMYFEGEFRELFENTIRKTRNGYDWVSLAHKMDQTILKFNAD